MKTPLELINEKIKQKALDKNIPYDAFIHNECMLIVNEFKNEFESQIIDAYNSGWQFGFITGKGGEITPTKNSEQYYTETFGDSCQADA